MRPAILVSYFYVDTFLPSQARLGYRDWMMDSGAYSAWNTGKEIDIHRYIDACHERIAVDPSLREIIALDVINDGKTSKAVTARKSLDNALLMKSKGLEVIPVFHSGEDWGILAEYCAAFGKVGLSCRFGEPEEQSIRFYDGCFSRAWPRRFHSFGWMTEEVMMRWPFHSLDSTSWELQPCVYGFWKRFGTMSVRGSEQDLRSQIRYYNRWEDKLRVRWARVMREINCEHEAPTIRLAWGAPATAVRTLTRIGEEYGTCPLYVPREAGEVIVKPEMRPVVERKQRELVVTPKRTSAELVDDFGKWDDYWKKRGFSRDPRANIQT